MHPRTLIRVIIQVIHNDGGLLAACVNGTCLALLDSGIPMYSPLVATTCALTTSPITKLGLLLDPTLEEEIESSSLFVFVFDKNINNIISSSTTGLFTAEEYFWCLEVCKRAAHKVLSFSRIAQTKQYKMVVVK
eukprot:TRINITY_DN1105_c0_g1_i3.p1 TRINITY_DN1105_c0_g1~~TRINITY_DN1105_c0_g1_i3.p1  ORF type:complete len:134 (-),score=16.53 TRINITY_DN1105_c0_g1_i3:143-544(-)